jgi:hypothetical protein
MHRVIAKTFVGLSAGGYLRHFFFAVLCAAPLVVLVTTKHLGATRLLPLIAIRTVLYPYARFLYERVAQFFVGQNVFVWPALVFLG